MSKDTLVIRGVDLQLLQEQREILAGLLTVQDEVLTAVLTEDELGAMDGILNMLDSWADQRDGVEDYG